MPLFPSRHVPSLLLVAVVLKGVIAPAMLADASAAVTTSSAVNTTDSCNVAGAVAVASSTFHLIMCMLASHVCCNAWLLGRYLSLRSLPPPPMAVNRM